MNEPFPFSQCQTIKPKDIEPVLGNPGWVMEPKIDGWRIQMHVTPEEIKSWTRTGHDATGKLWKAELELMVFAQDHVLDMVLDGEVVYMDENLRPDFNLTARIMGSGLDVAIGKQHQLPGYLTFFCFDLLWLDGHDMRPFSWEVRTEGRQTIANFVRTPYVQWVPHAVPSIECHQENIDWFGEGSILKDKKAPYSGKRYKSWLKWKEFGDADVVITSFKPGEGKYQDQVGAVEYAQFKDGVLTARGYCSGMTDQVRGQLSRDPYHYMGKVLQIKHYGILANGGFRHPQWQHLRDDKLATECTWS